MTGVKKIGIDMGNSTICVSAEMDGGDVKQTYIGSVYSLDTDLISGDVIECNGIKLALGVGQNTLTNVDKTNRELIEHQILWAVYSAFGTGTHYINLGIGLPISIYKAKKDSYTSDISSLGTIEGTINEKPISVNLTSVKVMAEGHASIRALQQYINKANTTLVINIGMKTTDVLLIEHNGASFKINKYRTINIALYDIYSVLREAIALQGVEVSIEDIDKRFKSENPVIRTEQGEYNLASHLPDAVNVCHDIIKAIENEFGKIVLHDKVFTGGGAEKFLQAIGQIDNNVEIPAELRYYSDSLGYLLGI